MGQNYLNNLDHQGTIVPNLYKKIFKCVLSGAMATRVMYGMGFFEQLRNGTIEA